MYYAVTIRRKSDMQNCIFSENCHEGDQGKWIDFAKATAAMRGEVLVIEFRPQVASFEVGHREGMDAASERVQI